MPLHFAGAAPRRTTDAWPAAVTPLLLEQRLYEVPSLPQTAAAVGVHHRGVAGVRRVADALLAAWDVADVLVPNSDEHNSLTVYQPVG